MIEYDVISKIITTKMIQFVKKLKNDLKLNDFLYISLNQLEHTESISSMTESQAQSLQSMRAREQNREHRARGLALKSGLSIPFLAFFTH